MPGIYGYIKQLGEKSYLNIMTHSLNYFTYFKKDDDFKDKFIESSKIHLGNMTKIMSPHSKDGINVWIEGEIYNLDECVKIANFNIKIDSFEELIFVSYKNNILKKVFNKIDGYFACTIYDSNKNKIFLISDRYGMRMLYYYFKDGRFAWSGEVKGLLALDFVDTSIDKSQINCFMELGYLLENNTFHKYIKLVEPATIMEFDVTLETLTQKYYWKWSQIKQQNISFNDAVDQLGILFLNSIKKRFAPNNKIGIALSGGLDSRAIFAAVNTLYPEYRGYTYTFGVLGCGDIEIAKKVVSRSKWRHEIFVFSSDNWFKSRIEKVWFTDGMLNMMHMHGSEFLDNIANNIDFNLNGYAGDVVCGGRWFPKIPLNTRATSENLKIFYNKYINLCNIEDSFFEINHIEPHLYMNRVRRFTNMGIVNTLYKLDQRIPFFDNDLIEFIFSLPDGYRANNKLYSVMLLKFFNKYFKDIPWQKTGRTIDKSINSSFIYKVLKKAKRIPIKLGLKKDLNNYTDYANWIRNKEVSNYLDKLLDNKTGNYSKYRNEDFRTKYLLPHIKHRRNFSENILRGATLELYLKKIVKR